MVDDSMDNKAKVLARLMEGGKDPGELERIENVVLGIALSGVPNDDWEKGSTQIEDEKESEQE